MILTGTVVSVDKDVEIEKNGGGTYPGTRLAYRDAQGALKEQAWHQNGLKYNHAVRNSLDELQAGDKFTMTKEKNDKGFWDVKSLIKGIAEATPKQAGNSYTPSKNNTGGGGNWPTSEERKETQTHIIRQNSVTNAVNFVSQTAQKKDQTVANVLQVAKQFEQFVLTGDTGDMTGLVSDDLDAGIE